MLFYYYYTVCRIYKSNTFWRGSSLVKKIKLLRPKSPQNIFLLPFSPNPTIFKKHSSWSKNVEFIAYNCHKRIKFSGFSQSGAAGAVPVGTTPQSSAQVYFWSPNLKLWGFIFGWFNYNKMLSLCRKSTHHLKWWKIAGKKATTETNQPGQAKLKVKPRCKSIRLCLEYKFVPLFTFSCRF